MSRSALEHSAVHLLHRAGQCAGDIFGDEMSKQGLTPRQYAVLVSVSENEGVSQTTLVERTGIDRSTLADIVRRMIKKGLLERRRTREDARAYAVRLSQEGRQKLALATPLAARADDRLLGSISGEDRQRFIEMLSAIVRSLGVSSISPPARAAE
ncbi:MAG: MarR family transcriptional regulator [Hyphomicrobiaceae bacterium]|nr:MAG: MarR family transcriptional regulator [Hyphomicrobiaceae bacterium]